jgi:hypothetical protein
MSTCRKLAAGAAVTAAVLLLVWWTVASFGARSLVSAFLVNWLAMSWAAMVGQAVRFRLPAKYYQARSFEGDGRIYERLGVRVFKMAVRRGPLAILSPTLRLPQERTVPALRALEGEMEIAEAAHLLVFFLVTVGAAAALVKGWLDAAGWLMLLNVLFNGYPVLLQRYNRILLRDLIGRQGKT